MVALDIVTEKQLQKMAVFAESKLAIIGEDVDVSFSLFVFDFELGYACRHRTKA